MKTCFILFISVCLVEFGLAQSFPQFKDLSIALKGYQQTRGFLPSAFTDVNGDLVDDLILFDRGLTLQVLKGNPYNKTLFANPTLTFPHYFDAFSIAVGDVNQDGISDFALGGSMGYVRVYVSQKDSFSIRNLPANFLVQTMNITDVNRDGYNDLFVCNDAGGNIFYINKGAGEFELNTNLIDFSTIPASDMSGNYGSVWVDVNHDKLPDLALAKCRAGVADPNDPRRINSLYINHGAEGFSNDADEWGFDLGQQSWAVTFGDYDNDGDVDAFVVNHYDPHVLLENVGGTHFSKTIFSEQELSSFAFQAVSRDFDNDGWLDIALAGLTGITILHNKKGLFFDVLDKIPLALRGMSMSIGDINDDGFYDIHAQLNESLNIPGQVDDRLYVNQKNSNHYLKFSLLPNQAEPTLSGSKIEVYGPWGIQSRQYIAGESFGITNSSHFHFGVGDLLVVDSVRIHWPAGNVDAFYALPTDQSYVVQPGNCIRPKVYLEQKVVLADTTQGVMLQAPAGFESYLWDDQSTDQTLLVFDEGQYFVIMQDDSGCLTYSYPVYNSLGCFGLGIDPLGSPDKIQFCDVEEKILEVEEADDYLWSTGATSREITVEETGRYVVTITDLCQNTLVDSVLVDFVSVPNIVVQFPDTVQANSRGFCVSSSQNTEWFTCDETIWLERGDTFYFDLKTRDTCFVAKGFQPYHKFSQTTGNRLFPALNQFGSGTLNGAVLFDVQSPMVLQSVDVYTDTPGKRKFLVTNQQGEVIHQKEVTVNFGFNTVPLSFALEPGNKYSLLTEKETNIAQLGTESPRFIRHAGGNIQYPYSIAGVLDITSSNFGTNNYYYFYNWKVEYDAQQCHQNGIKLPIHVDKTSNSVETMINSSNGITILPNPVHESFSLNVQEKSFPGQLTIFNIQGKPVLELTVHNGLETILVGIYPPGMYSIRYTTNKTTYFGKFIKE